MSDNNGQPTYHGQHACNAWQQLTGCGGCPPIENSGGNGTYGVHWNEFNEQNEQGFDLDAELMTGWQESGANVHEPISTITIASFQDLGYSVDYGKADTFNFNPTCTNRGLPGDRRASEGHVPTQASRERAIAYGRRKLAEWRADLNQELQSDIEECHEDETGAARAECIQTAHQYYADIVLCIDMMYQDSDGQTYTLSVCEGQ